MTNHLWYRLVTICLAATLFFSCTEQPATEKKARVLPFYNTADFTPQWIGASSAQYGSIHTIPPFSFTGQDGQEVTDQTVKGKIYVADFFFTGCPGICKQLTRHLALVQSAFKDDRRVLLLSHTVTPDIDDVAKLKAYAQANAVTSGKWFLLTGNRTDIYRIARNAYFADEDMGEQKNANDFLHTENVLLIDTHRRIRGIYKGTSVGEINNLIDDIKVLLAEK